MDLTNCTVQLSLSRALNFGYEEKEYLVSLVEKHSDLLQCKKSDSLTRQKKEKCWRKLTEEFNSVNMPKKRTKEQLSTLWKNLKTRARLHAERPYRSSTSGRSPSEDIKERIFDKVNEILNRPVDLDAISLNGNSAFDTSAIQDSTDGTQEIWVATGDSFTPVNEPTSPPEESILPDWTVEIQGKPDEKTKRTRGENFVLSEKELFVGILQNCIKTLEDERIDSIRFGHECWEKIRERFNSATKGPKRSKKQLSDLWNNIKQRAKKENTGEQHYRIAVGRTPPSPNTSPFDDRIYEIFESQSDSNENPSDEDTMLRTASKVGRGSSDRMKEGLVATGDTSASVKGISADSAEKTLLSFAKSEHDIRMGIIKAEHEAKMNVIKTKIALLKRKAEREEAIFAKKMKVLDSQLQDNCK